MQAGPMQADPCARDAHCNSNERINQTQDGLLPGMLRANASNYHHDRCRDACRDDVFGAPGEAQNDGSDSDQRGQTYGAERKDQEVKETEYEAQQSSDVLDRAAVVLSS
jgi:hypothetical protein